MTFVHAKNLICTVPVICNIQYFWKSKRVRNFHICFPPNIILALLKDQFLHFTHFGGQNYKWNQQISSESIFAESSTVLYKLIFNVITWTVWRNCLFFMFVAFCKFLKMQYIKWHAQALVNQKWEKNRELLTRLDEVRG